MSLASKGQRLPVPPLDHLEGQGSGPIGGGGFEDRISCPLFFASSSLSGSDFLSWLFPILHQGDSSSLGCFGSRGRGSGRASSLLSGVYSRLFVVWEASGS